MPLRVAVSLFTLLVLSTPALAQQDQLTGTWRFRSLAGIAGRGAICASGNVTFSSKGAVTDGSLQECNPDVLPTPLTGGTVTVDASGRLSGSVSTFGLQGNFLPAGNAFVSVNTVNQSSPSGFGLGVFVKDTATAFVQTDLTGTWRVLLLQGGELPTDLSENGFGTIEVAADGKVTGGALTFFSFSPGLSSSSQLITGGNVLIDADGGISGTIVSTDGGPVPQSTVISGLMATDKKLVAGAVRTIDDGASAVETGLALLQREPSSTFATADLAGTWTLDHLLFDPFTATDSTWVRGTLTLDQSGAVTSSTVVNAFGLPVPLAGAFAVDPTGFVGAALATDTTSLTIEGSMFDSKAHIIGINTLFDVEGVDGPGGPAGVALFSMSKAAATPAAVVQFSAPTYKVTEGTASAAISVVRTGIMTTPFTVTVTASPVTAVPDQDFTPVSGTLTFAAGAASRTFNVPITNNSLVDGNRSVLLSLGAPAGAAVLGPQSSATLTIVDNDAGGQVKLGAAAYSVTEGAGNASITVVRTGGTASAVTVDYATADGTATAGADYVATSGSLTFAANQMSATITVPIIQDLLAEGNETFTVTLSNPRGGATLGAPFVTTVTIVDDESAIQFSAADYTIKEGTPAVVTIQRSGALVTPATVTFTATPGTAVPGLDFTPVSTVVSFPVGIPSKAVAVPILNNRLVQGDRTVLLGLSGPTGGAHIGARGGATLTITEDDQGGVVKLGASSYTVSEAAGALAVTLMRIGTNLAGNVSVSYATGNGSAVAGLDYTDTGGTVTFKAGETSKTVSIPILNDTVVEPGKTFTFTLTEAAGGATLGVPSAATITIKDDDVPSQIRLGAASYKVLEGAGNVSIMVVRSVATFREVTVHYSTNPTGTNPATPDVDYGDASGDLTFAPNQTTAFITIPIIQDALAEGNETFLVTLSDPQGGAILAPPSSATVTIQDDESVVQFSLRFIGNMPEVVRTGPANTQVTVDFSSEDGTATGGVDYMPVSGTLTFKVGQSAAYIPLLIVPDILAEGPETFTMFLTNPQPEGSASLGPVSSQTWTITDNDFGGTVQFGTAAATALPGESKAIPIVRTGGGGTILTVNWRAISGTSSEAFSPTSGSVTFGANETTKSFTVDVANFDGVQPDVTAVFALSVPPGAANIGATNRSTLTIFGSRATVDLAFSLYSVVEGGGPAVVSVVRGGNLDRQVSVAYATSNDTALAGRDYAATSGRLTFAVGQETAAFTVPIISNGPSGQTRSLNLTLSSPSPNTVIGEGATARLRIREAPVFTYRLVADNTDTILSFGGVPSLNDGGAVAYKAVMTDDTVRVVRDIAGAKLTIATAGPADLLGIDGNRFPLDADGNVFFLATAGNERQTIFRGAGGSLLPLMQTDQTYTQLYDPAVSPNGTVAFAAAQGDAGPAIFTGPGAVGVSLLAASGDEVFSLVGALPSVNDDGTVAFVGVRDGVRDIFLANPNRGGLPAIATGVSTDTFANVSLNGAEQVAFITDLPPGDQGIQIARNGSAVTTFVTRASGFQLFGQDGDATPVVNALGDVAYRALTLEAFGILTGPDPTANMVIQEGDPLFGSNVTGLRFGGFNAAGQISFIADLVDGRQVVVVGTPPAAQADLAITGSVDGASPTVGSNVTFTLTARNNGPASVAGVQVAQALPNGYAFVSATPGQGAAAFSSGSVLWSLGTLAGSGAASSATLSVVATVLPTGTYNSSASITTAGGARDPNTANNTTTVVVTPLLQADIAVTKTVDSATPLVGTSVVFTITATNGGPVAATGVQVTDALPSGYTFVSSTPSQGTYASGTGIWTIGNLAAGGANSSATLRITATVRATGVYDNTASRTASSPTDPNAANNTATVTVTPTTGITLTTQGPLVGVGRTISGTVTLPSPAPAGGVNVTLDSTPPGLVTVTPSPVLIPAGSSSGSFTVLGAAVGSATITGAATGFVGGNVSVTVTSSVISLGALPTLGLGQSVSLPISLSTAAPAGGVTVSFTSDKTNIATVTGSVFIPQGAQVPAANPQVTGANIGSAQITASAIGFAPDSRTANVAVNVSFTPTTFPVVVGSTSNITVNISAAAPAGGLTFNLATGNTSVATVVSPITVPAGQLSVPAAVTGKVVAQTTLHASGAGVTSGTATINVTTPPGISVVGNSIGKDLQVASSFTLGAAAPAGGVQVTLTSSDATKLLLSTSKTAVGSGQVKVTVGAGASFSGVLYYQALDSTGTVTVTASAPGYANGTATVTLAPSGFIINSPGSISTTTLSANSNVVITSSRLNPATLAWVSNQELRAGARPVTVSVAATDPAGGSGVGAMTPGSVVFNGADSLQLTAFDPAAVGTSTIAVATPTGFSTPANFRTITATVTTPTITLNPVTVGQNLQVATSFSIQAPAPTGGLAVTLTSGDVTKLLLSSTETGAGTGEITVTVPQGGFGGGGIWLQALDGTGGVTVTLSATGFATAQTNITLAPSGFIINSPGAISTTSLSSNTNIQITSARLNAALQWQQNQGLRAGISPVSVSVTATDQGTGTGVGTITPGTVVFSGGDVVKNVAFDPAADGTSVIAVEPPTGFSTPTNFRTIVATVTTPAISLANQVVGKDLQVFASLSIGAPAPSGGQPVTLTSSDATKLVLSSSATAVGSGQLVITVPQGSSSSGFLIQALDSTGPVTVTATAPGFQGAVATVTLTPSGFIINSPGSFTTSTFSSPTNVQITSARLDPASLVWQTNQPVRGGLAPVTVTVTATDQAGGPGVGAMTPGSVVFNPNDSVKSTTFDPAASGTSLVQVVTPAGFSTPSTFRSIAATVTAPTIAIGNAQVGRDLQQSVSVSLGAPPPGPVTVTVTVASTAVATLTTDGTVAGGNTVTFTNVTTQFVGNVIVQGRASSGTTTLTVQAPGYADGLSTVTAQPSGFIINAPGAINTTVGGGNVNVQITPARLNATTLNWETNQPVRGGLTVNVPVTAVDQTGSGVGTITTSPLVFTGNVSALTTQFDPAAAGTSQVTVGVPAGFSTPSNFRSITATVNP